MNENTYTFPGPQLEPAPRKPSTLRRLAPLALTALVALAVGTGIGAAHTPAPVEVPGPERVVTKTETKTVEVTPVSCATALDLAEQVIGSAGRAAGYASEAMGSVARFDAAGVKAAGAKIDTETQTVKGLTPKYQTAKAACLSK